MEENFIKLVENLQVQIDILNVKVHNIVEVIKKDIEIQRLLSKRIEEVKDAHNEFVNVIKKGLI